MKREPRPHQLDAIRLLGESVAKGNRRIMVQMPTGAGKTLFAAMLIQGALETGRQVTFAVPAISLVDQTVEAFEAEGIRNIGVMQASHERTDYEQPVQVASIQTLMRRPKRDDMHLVFIDEAHITFDFINEWLLDPAFSNVVFVGLSATPWSKGLGLVYQDLIISETTQGLIDKGYLSPFRVFAPAHPDLTGVPTEGEDYSEKQLSKVMQEGGLIAGIVTTWLEKGENRPTLCFAVDRAHAKKIQKQFQSAQVPCGYIDMDTLREEREEIRKQFESGLLNVVVNIATLTAGIDWDVRCIILARPTKSEKLYVQIVGRGLRTAKGKADLILLDHSDTTLRLGFVTTIHHEKLCDGKPKDKAERKKRDEPLPKECGKCHYLKPAKVHVCPECGFKPEKVSEIFETNDELVEAKGKPEKYTMEQKQIWFSSLLHIEAARGYKRGWADRQFKERFKAWPNQLRKIPTEPLPEVQNYVKSRMIAFAKRRTA